MNDVNQKQSSDASSSSSSSSSSSGVGLKGGAAAAAAYRPGDGLSVASKTPLEAITQYVEKMDDPYGKTHIFTKDLEGQSLLEGAPFRHGFLNMVVIPDSEYTDGNPDIWRWELIVKCPPVLSKFRTYPSCLRAEIRVAEVSTGTVLFHEETSVVVSKSDVAPGVLTFEYLNIAAEQQAAHRELRFSVKLYFSEPERVSDGVLRLCQTASRPSFLLRGVSDASIAVHDLVARTVMSAAGAKLDFAKNSCKDREGDTGSLETRAGQDCLDIVAGLMYEESAAIRALELCPWEVALQGLVLADYTASQFLEDRFLDRVCKLVRRQEPSVQQVCDVLQEESGISSPARAAIRGCEIDVLFNRRGAIGQFLDFAVLSAKRAAAVGTLDEEESRRQKKKHKTGTPSVL